MSANIHSTPAMLYCVTCFQFSPTSIIYTLLKEAFHGDKFQRLVYLQSVQDRQPIGRSTADKVIKSLKQLD